MMMPAGDDDDDFIVQTVVETGASDAQENGAFGWGLKKLGGLGGLMFSKADGTDQRDVVVEPEPTLPPAFSATLNAEEEEIYPAEVKIKVLVAEGNLGGRGRRQAAELHQALQQVVGAAAMYNHLLSKHGGVGTRRKRGVSDPAGGGNVKAAACDCGGSVGSCKAISSLLKAELDKISAAAEAERKGALLKKFRQVERRSGGLCNPDLLEKVVRSSSSDVKTSPKMPPPSAETLRPALAGGKAPAPKDPGMSVVGLTTPAPGGGAFFATDSNAGGIRGGVRRIGGNAEDVPWADDMLCSANRRRNGALLRTRGRALAKSLTRQLIGVSKDLQGVASRLPPWEEDEESEEDTPEDQSSFAHSRNASRSSFTSVDTTDSFSSEKPLEPKATSPAAAAAAAAASAAATAAATTAAAVAAARGGRKEARARRQDWKLDAQELSLIRREEERVMKPPVLARLLAAGARLECLQQADFWDVFARLEVVTRTEALLNIAVRGGRGCPARAARMGRELCMSLTSVVLDAINTVEQDERFNSTNSQPPPQPQQLPLRDSDPNNGFATQQHDAAPRKQRPSSERLSRGFVLGGPQAILEGRARAGSMGNGVPSQRRAAKAERASGPLLANRFKEDPGLADLDEREEEFRKAIYVNRSALANRLLQLTHDAPLCAKVLGTFVNDAADAGQTGDNRPWTTGSTDSTAPYCPRPKPSPTTTKSDQSSWESASGGDGSQDAFEGGDTCSLERGGSRTSCESHPSPALSMASTDLLSEGTDDSGSEEQSPQFAQAMPAASCEAKPTAPKAQENSKITSAFRDSRENDPPLPREASSSFTAPNSPPAF